VNEDRDWNQLGNTWRSGPQTALLTSRSQTIPAAARRASRRRILTCAAVVTAVVFITSLCFLRRSIEVYTFAVIVWSALFSFGGYFIAVQERARDLALATTDALRTRSRRLARTIQLLEFARVLVGVETIICAGFWIVSRFGAWSHAWAPASLIVIFGILLYCVLSWSRLRTRREHYVLEALVRTVEDSM
jgi:small-conductance mechanosensitive channel